MAILHNDYAPEHLVQGAPGSPQAAVESVLDDVDRLAPSDFRMAEATSTTARFLGQGDDTGRAAIDVVRYADGWVVTELATCENVLRQVVPDAEVGS